MENKPFIFGVATSGDNFTDRTSETARLLTNFQHGINTVLISPRRWGKTSLVQKVCHLAKCSIPVLLPVFEYSMEWEQKASICLKCTLTTPTVSAEKACKLT